MPSAMRGIPADQDAPVAMTEIERFARPLESWQGNIELLASISVQFAEMRTLAQALGIDLRLVDHAFSEMLVFPHDTSDQPAKYDSERSSFEEWCAAVDELLMRGGTMS